MTVEAITTPPETTAAVGRAYPFVNDWRKGCWVKRPNGRPDRDYVWAGEFVTGSPHKASGFVRYTLADLDGPGWIVYKDRRRIRGIVFCGELEWFDYGEITAADILLVVATGTDADRWHGARCPDCLLGVLAADERICGACHRDREESARARRHLEAIPSGDVF